MASWDMLDLDNDPIRYSYVLYVQKTMHSHPLFHSRGLNIRNSVAFFSYFRDQMFSRFGTIIAKPIEIQQRKCNGDSLHYMGGIVRKSVEFRRFTKKNFVLTESFDRKF